MIYFGMGIMIGIALACILLYGAAKSSLRR